MLQNTMVPGQFLYFWFAKVIVRQANGRMSLLNSLSDTTKNLLVYEMEDGAEVISSDLGMLVMRS